jgi:hypothetical protein
LSSNLIHQTVHLALVCIPIAALPLYLSCLVLESDTVGCVVGIAPVHPIMLDLLVDMQRTIRTYPSPFDIKDARHALIDVSLAARPIATCQVRDRVAAVDGHQLP